MWRYAYWGGVNSVWAVDLPTPVYSNDFSSSTGLEIVGNGAFEDDADAHFGKFFHNDPTLAKAIRTNYLKLPTDVLSHSATSKEITIGFWVNKKDATDYFYCPIFSAYDKVPYSGTLANSTSGLVNDWTMFTCESRGLLQYNMNSYSGGWCDFTAAQNDNSSNTESTTWLDDGNWHYFTITMTTTKAIVYVDGTPLNSWTIPDASAFFEQLSNLSYVCLGGNQTANYADIDPAYGFDDFAVYDEALTPAQIEKIIDTKLGYTVVTYDFTSYGSKTLTYESDRCANANSANFYRPTNLPEALGRFAFAHNDAVSVSSTNGLYLQRAGGDYAAILGLAANDKITINLISGNILWRSGSTAISVADWTDYTAGTELKTTAAGNLFYQGKNTCKISSIIIKTLTAETMTAPTISSEANGDARTVTITDGVSNIMSGVTTYYTTDGSTPTSASTVYSAPFDVNATCTVKAITISSSSAETASSVASQLIDFDAVDIPTAAITAVDGINRTVSFSCTTDGATLYYSTDNGANYTAGTSLVISTNTYIKVKATKGLAVSESENTLFEAGTAITLNKPQWTKTGYSAGVSTVTLADNQSDKLLTPVSTIKYKINSGDTQTYNGTPFNVNDVETLTYWSEATGYTNSPEGSVTATAPCTYPNFINETYNGSNTGITVNTEEVVTRIGGSSVPCYYMYSNESRISENLITANTGASNWLLRSTGIYAGNTINYALANVQKNDIVTVQIIWGTENPVPTSVDGTLDEWNSVSGNTYVFEVTSTTGYFRFSLGRYASVKSIRVQRPLATPGATVNPTYGYATFAANVPLDLSTLTDGFTAYVATSVAPGAVTMSSHVGMVPAGTGLFIKGSGAFTITETREATTPPATNYLVGVTANGTVTASAGGTYHYVFAVQDDEVAFFNVATDAAITAGKAYLETTTDIKPDAGARVAIIFDDESTGISTMQNTQFIMHNDVYDLQGRRVAAPTKGLYIMNGKKVVIK